VVHNIQEKPHCVKYILPERLLMMNIYWNTDKTISEPGVRSIAWWTSQLQVVTNTHGILGGS
jgi:hypothetical protein